MFETLVVSEASMGLQSVPALNPKDTEIISMPRFGIFYVLRSIFIMVVRVDFAEKKNQVQHARFLKCSGSYLFLWKESSSERIRRILLRLISEDQT